MVPRPRHGDHQLECHDRAGRHVAGQFAGANGRHVFHCHILEHEDEGMMRTFVVMPEQVMKLDRHVVDGHHPLHPA
ncbi:MAG: multicopper oxidase domain-containing protein [Pseudonocardiaceae bacterium]